ncbi:MAG TPA: hypothetical protein VGO16_12465 [Pseudonocardiaceae bacterium]|nr:hypothetical protein [Pseudonocardiaceae bacterium]
MSEAGAQQIVSRVRWLAEQGIRLITGTDAGMGTLRQLPRRAAGLRAFPAALQGFAQWSW